MKNNMFLLITLLSITFSNVSEAQYEKFKAVYIFNFTKYIEWNAAGRQGNFIIGVVSNHDIVEHLKVIAQKRKVGNQPIEIRVFKTAKDITKCNILYLPSNQSNQMDESVAKATNNNTLIITDKQGMVQKGSCINFYTESDQLKFEFSEKNLVKNSLKTNSSLQVLGKKID